MRVGSIILVPGTYRLSEILRAEHFGGKHDFSVLKKVGDERWEVWWPVAALKDSCRFFAFPTHFSFSMAVAIGKIHVLFSKIQIPMLSSSEIHRRMATNNTFYVVVVVVKKITGEEEDRYDSSCRS